MILSCIDQADRSESELLIEQMIMLEIHSIFYFHFDGQDLSLKLEFKLDELASRRKF